MSEFTDFFALQSDAATLDGLRAALIAHVGGADVPLGELDVDFTEGVHVVEDAWRKTSKPIWIKLGIHGTLEDLANVGPAVHIQVEEDFSSWSLEAICSEARFEGTILLEPGRYRGVTDDTPLYSGDADDLAQIAPCFGLNAQEMHALMVPDGSESFSAAVGITYEQMLDMTLDPSPPGEVWISVIY